MRQVRSHLDSGRFSGCGMEANGERASFTWSGALGLHRASVQLYQPANDGEPYPEPASRAVDRLAPLCEQIEDVGQELGADSHTVVPDDDGDLISRSMGLNVDVTARL